MSVAEQRSTVEFTLKLAKIAFIGQETVTEQQRHNFSLGMYTLIAVFVHFKHFIDLKINFHTNPYNLASSTAVVILGALWLYLSEYETF